MSTHRSLAIFGLVALMIVWGSTFVVTKVAVADIPPLTLSALRFVIAAAVLAPIAFARGGLGTLPRPLPVVPLALMALTGITLFHVGFNYALLYGSASQGALIFALVPAAVAVAAVVALKENPSRRRTAGIVLSIGGVAFIVAAGEQDAASPRPLLGALWMLAAVAAWAVYTVFAKRLAHADQIVVIAIASAIGAAMQVPFAAIELMETGWPSPSLVGILAALFLGVVASAAAFVLYSWVLRELDASLVGAFINLDPIVGVLTAFLFLGEALNLLQAVGGGIALVGMWLASTAEK